MKDALVRARRTLYQGIAGALLGAPALEAGVTALDPTVVLSYFESLLLAMIPVVIAALASFFQNLAELKTDFDLGDRA